VGFQKIVEELHVELVILHDHHGLRHCRGFPRSSALALIPSRHNPL
jgi:hypothetical protein